MIYTEQTKKAMIIAYNAHHGQVDKFGVPYLDYVKNLKSNPIARKVKLADLRHNSDMSRLPNPTEKDWKRKEKYEKAIQILIDDCEN